VRNRILLVTLTRLNRAVARVVSELDQHGLWDAALRKVEVYLVPVGFAYGWCWSGNDGYIAIPAVSGVRFYEYCRTSYTSLVDVLRHEYGHALADTHRRLVRSAQFRDAFGASYDSERKSTYDPLEHVSDYAASKPSEDFAESFMFYLKHGGRLPRRYRVSAIKTKWGFVRQLCGVIRRSSSTRAVGVRATSLAR
jgi:hypothetical protein